MFEFIINALKEISIFVGYIKNNTYLSPLSEDEEDLYVNDWLTNKNNISRNKLIEQFYHAGYIF